MEDKLIVVATESNSKALVLKSYLEANGIECFLQNVNVLQGAIAEGVKVLIRETDAEKALQLLSALGHTEDVKKVEQQLRKILVPVDFSEPSQNAARYAVMLASKYNAQIKLLHVFNSPVVDMIPFTDVASVQIDFDMNYHVLYSSAKERLIKFYENLKAFANQMGYGHVQIGYTLREGYAAYGIIEASKRYKPGIIIMGTKGEGYRSTELVGSVATEVSDETHIPLLVIPEKAVLKGVDEVKKVLYITNFDENDNLSIRKLLRIVSPFQVELHCIHITDKPDTPGVKALMNTTKDYISSVTSGIPITCEVIVGKGNERSVIDYISKNHINLVALTSVKRNLLYKLFNPSLAKRMIYQADVPVLLFHA
ncbi:MAG: universal stress protein [Bacteroidota bacterium]